VLASDLTSWTNFSIIGLETEISCRSVSSEAVKQSRRMDLPASRCLTSQGPREVAITAAVSAFSLRPDFSLSRTLGTIAYHQCSFNSQHPIVQERPKTHLQVLMRNGIVIEEIRQQNFISLSSPFIRDELGVDEIDTEDITEENDGILFPGRCFLGVGDVCSESVDGFKVSSGDSFVDV
jgi:hypothetical protein